MQKDLTLGFRLRVIRDALDLSRPKFADMLEFPATSLKNYELGYRELSAPVLLLALNHEKSRALARGLFLEYPAATWDPSLRKFKVNGTFLSEYDCARSIVYAARAVMAQEGIREPFGFEANLIAAWRRTA